MSSISELLPHSVTNCCCFADWLGSMYFHANQRYATTLNFHVAHKNPILIQTVLLLDDICRYRFAPETRERKKNGKIVRYILFNLHPYPSFKPKSISCFVIFYRIILCVSPVVHMRYIETDNMKRLVLGKHFQSQTTFVVYF